MTSIMGQTGRTGDYLLGDGQAERDRLHRQQTELAGDSAWLFDQIGVRPGHSVAEIGCGPRGCLEDLSERVGPTGRVVGVERDEVTVAQGQAFLAERRLANVEIVRGDGAATELPRDAYDVVTTRLVLVNIPNPERLVAEAFALCRNGGVVAYHDVVWPLGSFDPPCPAWEQLYELAKKYTASRGIDLHIGLRLPRLLREQGLVNIEARSITHVCPPGHARRTIPADILAAFAPNLVAEGLISDDELGQLRATLRSHIEQPETFVVSPLYIQAWGTKP
ncbi:MAG TPA: methyltransferase domain-containing protein [Acidimicrobiales bacterium]|nr:methyltransferase domain-containing protein [Acidimicrobiales bacterium]